MDKALLRKACKGIEAFFTEELKTLNPDWTYEGQTIYERIEGWTLRVIDEVEDEIESGGDQTHEEDDDESADEDA